jgi:hypothetical protein
MPRKTSYLFSITAQYTPWTVILFFSATTTLKSTAAAAAAMALLIRLIEPFLSHSPTSQLLSAHLNHVIYR